MNSTPCHSRWRTLAWIELYSLRASEAVVAIVVMSGCEP